ncbi:hypothetical protein G5714_024729 [Onychostoma macrolepis]|uniref:Uncharacterized protein n=1 Tax=Onychostoma macrolepis TaxID=369639 RepID=A0A7J6BHF9_9TELE|nr:hypothetical protein G5714_024729 [Onychostoma macrolepis]
MGKKPGSLAWSLGVECEAPGGPLLVSRTGAAGMNRAAGLRRPMPASSDPRKALKMDGAGRRAHTRPSAARKSMVTEIASAVGGPPAVGGSLGAGRVEPHGADLGVGLRDGRRRSEGRRWPPSPRPIEKSGSDPRTGVAEAGAAAPVLIISEPGEAGGAPEEFSFLCEGPGTLEWVRRERATPWKRPAVPASGELSSALENPGRRCKSRAGRTHIQQVSKVNSLWRVRSRQRKGSRQVRSVTGIRIGSKGWVGRAEVRRGWAEQRLGRRPPSAPPVPSPACGARPPPAPLGVSPSRPCRWPPLGGGGQRLRGAGVASGWGVSGVSGASVEAGPAGVRPRSWRRLWASCRALLADLPSYGQRRDLRLGALPSSGRGAQAGGLSARRLGQRLELNKWEARPEQAPPGEIPLLLSFPHLPGEAGGEPSGFTLLGQARGPRGPRRDLPEGQWQVGSLTGRYTCQAVAEVSGWGPYGLPEDSTSGSVGPVGARGSPVGTAARPLARPPSSALLPVCARPARFGQEGSRRWLAASGSRALQTPRSDFAAYGVVGSVLAPSLLPAGRGGAPRSRCVVDRADCPQSVSDRARAVRRGSGPRKGCSRSAAVGHPPDPS